MLRTRRPEPVAQLLRATRREIGLDEAPCHRTVAQRPVCRPADFEHACAKLGATDCTTLAALLHGDRSGCVPSHAQSE